MQGHNEATDFGIFGEQTPYEWDVAQDVELAEAEDFALRMEQWLEEGGI